MKKVFQLQQFYRPEEVAHLVEGASFSQYIVPSCVSITEANPNPLPLLGRIYRVGLYAFRGRAVRHEALRRLKRWTDATFVNTFRPQLLRSAKLRDEEGDREERYIDATKQARTREFCAEERVCLAEVFEWDNHGGDHRLCGYLMLADSEVPTENVARGLQVICAQNNSY